MDDELSCSNIGGRKGRIIRDHLFLVYGIINDVMNGSSPPIDMQAVDIYKCFDEMWYSETHNDMYDAKVQDNKFSLIAKMDEKAEVVVKTPCGLTEEFTVNRSIMQGSVFGPIKSTVTIDTLGRDCEKYNQGLFKYKGVLSILPLALIDDCLGISKCGADAVEMNAILNTKIISKKLRLSAKKCHHLHFSKNKTNCYSNLKADDIEMKKSTECSYLGDILCSDGSIDATIESRRQKGIGIVNQITGMVNGLSLGHHFYRISFIMRETMLLNGYLTNSEVWYPIKDNQIEILEDIDLMLIRKLVNGHSKAPKEAFFMEAGLVPVRFVMMKRRMMYLHNLLSKQRTELIRNFYEVQKDIRTKHDWYELAQQNKAELKIAQSDEQISEMKEEQFRNLVTKAVAWRAMDYLNTIALGHSKSKPLIKQSLAREKYFLDNRFSKSEIELLLALRSRMIPTIKNNFSSQYKNNLDCNLCHVKVCSQEHLLHCIELTKHVQVPSDIDYSDLFRNTDKQLKIIKVFRQLLIMRELLIEE